MKTNNKLKVIIRRARPLYESMLIKPEGFIMPSDAVFNAKIRALEKRWDTWGSKIVAELKKTTGLTFMEQDIRCYVTAGLPASFSHPLTLRIYPTMDRTFDVLVHELIHRLFDNPKHPKRYQNARKKFLEEYSNESSVTRNHIILMAVHAHILLKFFGQKRLKIASSGKHPDYARGWQIVNELGYQNILKQVFDTH